MKCFEILCIPHNHFSNDSDCACFFIITIYISYFMIFQVINYMEFLSFIISFSISRFIPSNYLLSCPYTFLPCFYLFTIPSIFVIFSMFFSLVNYGIHFLISFSLLIHMYIIIFIFISAYMFIFSVLIKSFLMTL